MKKFRKHCRKGFHVLVSTLLALLFLGPIYVVAVTSIKPESEIQGGNLLSLPQVPTIQAWKTAWSSACTGLNCDGVSPYIFNSVYILVPSVILSIIFGAIAGYTLRFWKPYGSDWLMNGLLLGTFIPFQVYLFPFAAVLAAMGLYGTIAAIVLIHIVIAFPLLTLLFRNYYLSIPDQLVAAARMDGAGFWLIFVRIILPVSTPALVVAAIIQITNVWNDFLFGLVFAGTENRPITVALNNIVNSGTGAKAYSVNMAATLMAAILPLLVYLVSGRWFVRGIAHGAVKG